MRSPRLWLLVVALCYGAAQFLVMDLSRWFAWDEAIYASEVSRFADAIYLDAHRARGVTFIVAPVLQVIDSILATRIYMVVVASVGLGVSFLPWIRLVGRAAPIAAAIFASSWLSLFYGSEVMPNLYSAYFVLAAIGLALLYLQVGTRFIVLGMAACMAFLAFLRPLDAATTVAALGSISFFIRRRASLKVLVGAAAGLGLGLVPWLVEAQVRFGGPLQRLERTRELVGGGTKNNVLEYLRLLDGPLSGPDPSQDLGWPIVLWLLSLVGLSVLALIMPRREDRSLSRLAVLCSFWLAVPYLALSEAAAPRFLLPSLALLSLAAAIGLGSIRFDRRPAFGGIVIACLLIAMTMMNIGVFTEISAQQSAARARGLLLADALDDRSQAGACFFLSPSGFPQIAYASGCDGSTLTIEAQRNAEKLQRARDDGKELFLIDSDVDRMASLSDAWVCAPIEGLENRNWHVCEFDGDKESI